MFDDPMLKQLSTDAKVLYGLMLDRMGLSLRNGWFDEEGRVYIYFSVEKIMAMLGCANSKCTWWTRQCGCSVIVWEIR